jgi:hypothetical protein
MIRRKSGKPKPPTEEPVLKAKAVIPGEISQFKATLKKLSSGAYQRRVLSHYAQEGIVTAVQSLIQSAADGSVQASAKLLEVYKVLESKSMVSVVNNVDARSLQVTTGESGDVRGHSNFIRMLAEQREKRKLEGPVVNGHPTLDATFTETPVGPRAD